MSIACLVTLGGVRAESTSWLERPDVSSLRRVQLSDGRAQLHLLSNDGGVAHLLLTDRDTDGEVRLLVDLPSAQLSPLLEEDCPLVSEASAVRRDPTSPGLLVLAGTRLVGGALTVVPESSTGAGLHVKVKRADGGVVDGYLDKRCVGIAYDPVRPIPNATVSVDHLRAVWPGVAADGRVFVTRGAGRNGAVDVRYERAPLAAIVRVPAAQVRPEEGGLGVVGLSKEPHSNAPPTLAAGTQLYDRPGGRAIGLVRGPRWLRPEQVLIDSNGWRSTESFFKGVRVHWKAR